MSRRIGGAFCVLFLPFAPAAFGQTYTINTAVGAGPPNNVQAQSTSLSFGQPTFLAADASGDVYFVEQNAVIQRNASTGLLTIVAGNGTTGYSGDSGPATSAQLNSPRGLAVDSSGNLYITDAGNNVIREVSGGIISTIAGGGMTTGCANGAALSIALNGPAGLAVDSHGNVFIADTEDYCIREVSSGKIATVAGTGVPSTGQGSGDGGPATAAKLGFIASIAVDSHGNLYIADPDEAGIREVNAATGVINIVAGSGSCNPCTYGGDGGPATSAQLGAIEGVAVDGNGDIFISQAESSSYDPATQSFVLTSYNVIRKVTNGIIGTVAGDNALGAGFSGDGGLATSAQLSSPQTVAVDGSGNLYIADQGNNRIREVSNGSINTIAGNGSIGDNGPATGAQLGLPVALGLDTAGNLYIGDNQMLLVRKVSASTGIITTIAGNRTSGATIVNGSSATSVGLDAPEAVAADKNGNVYISNSFACTILKVSAGLISTFAGTGTCGYNGDGIPATSAELGNSFGLATDSSNNVYLSDDVETSDTTAARVREVSSGTINTVAGNGLIGPTSVGDGGPATQAELNFPAGLAIDSLGNLYIADVYNNNIRMVSTGSPRIITTVAGSPQGQYGFSGDGQPPTSALLNNPGGVAVDSLGNIYIADTSNNRIRKVSGMGAGGALTITTIAGNGTSGYTGDGGPATAAQLNNPMDVAVNSNGSVLVADGSGRIRVLTPSGSSCSYTGVPSTLPVPTAGANESIAVGTNAFCPWSVSGALPSWITLTGPSSTVGSGNANFAVAANSGAARNASIVIAGISVAVTQSGSGSSPLSITGPSTLPGGMVAAPYPATTIIAAGGSGSYTWSATGLPPGLTIGSTTGIVSGSPTTTAGSPFSVTVKVTDSASDTKTMGYSVTVAVSPCDINQDGVVNLVDLQLLLKQALGLNMASNDLNGDKKVNAVDLQIDLNAVIGLGCSAPL